MPRRTPAIVGTFAISGPAGPLISGSRLNLDVTGVDGPVAFSVIGDGRIEGSTFVAPLVSRETTATVIASARGAVALRELTIVPAPSPKTPLLAVATYRDGIALHDPRSFRLIGYVPIGGAPGDVTFDRHGALFAPDTDSDAMAIITRAPWRIRIVHGVALGNEIAFDSKGGAIFVSNRDAGGFGALTRVTRSGGLVRVTTGNTAEGLAIDPRRELVYVGNVNDNSVAVVDARSMRVLRKIPSVERTFGIALDRKTQRLYVVSNTSPSMPSRSGYVAAIDLRLRKPHITLRSRRFVFPIGAALDERANRLFVTDEAKDVAYVLSAKTLHTLRAPLRTCDTPWRPHIAAGRLYVPCAGSNKIDVYDLRTLRRVHGAPFATGGFPLSVALWP
jgi:DNA-binding beta-propeller fold protein YncE